MCETSVLFFLRKKMIAFRENFSVASVKNTECAWKNIKNYPWKTQSARENFEKKPSLKIRFWYVKKNKNRIRENGKVAVKVLKKSLQIPFLQTFFNFVSFFLYPAIFILLIQNYVLDK